MTAVTLQRIGAAHIRFLPTASRRPAPGAMTLDELDAVNGGSLIGDIVDRVVAIYHYCTGTITSHATTLP